MSLAFKAATLGAFAATALAHGTVTGYTADGVYHQGFLLDYYYAEVNNGEIPPHSGWYAENLDNGFVDGNDYGSSDIDCHKNSRTAPNAGTVSAGGSIDFHWTDWPESHVGPVLTYVAKVDDFASAKAGALEWVKIDEAGFSTETNSWAGVDLIGNNNTWTTTVPSELAAGNYVFRHEIIALHAGGDLNGAQNYPQCFNIEVTGSGSESPAGVLGTELYKNTDAGIQFSPYGDNSGYEIPGPALFGSGGSSQPAPGNGSGNSTAPPATTPTPTAPATGPVVTETATTIIEVEATATSAPTSAPAPPTSGNGGNNNGNGENSNTLPETFTLETFISWLQSVAGGSNSNTRRHARAF